LKGRNPKGVAMDSDGIQIVTVDRINQFGCLIFHPFNNSMGKPFGRILTHLGVHIRWMNFNIFFGDKITIDKALIA
jgi:hypothetical protein